MESYFRILPYFVLHKWNMISGYLHYHWIQSVCNYLHYNCRVTKFNQLIEFNQSIRRRTSERKITIILKALFKLTNQNWWPNQISQSFNSNAHAWWNGKYNRNSYFWKQKRKLIIRSIEIKIDAKNVMFWLLKKTYERRKTEAVAQRCSVKKVFLEISQNSQENTCTRVSFLIKLQAPPGICH